MQLLCAIEKGNIQKDGDVVLEAQYELEKQRGVWNKDKLKWWVKGQHKEEIFDESREVFLRKVFNLAFTEVDIEIPIIFIMADSEEDADIVIEFTKRKDAQYHSTNTNVLAYAGYADGALKGIMVIFTDWQWNVSGNLNIISVIIHELLHILGRPHSERKLWKDIMDPSINSKIRELSDWDIKGLTTAYGERVYSTDTGHDRLEKANRHQKERLMVEGLLPYKA